MGILEIFFGAIALGLIVGAIHYIGDKSCHIIFDPLKKRWKNSLPITRNSVSYSEKPPPFKAGASFIGGIKLYSMISASSVMLSISA